MGFRIASRLALLFAAAFMLSAPLVSSQPELIDFPFPGAATPKELEDTIGFDCKSTFPLDQKVFVDSLSCISAGVAAGNNIFSQVCKCVNGNLPTEEDQCQISVLLQRLSACANLNYFCPPKPLTLPAFGLPDSQVNFDTFDFDQSLPLPATTPPSLLDEEAVATYTAATAVYRAYGLSANTYCFGLDTEDAFASDGSMTVLPGATQLALFFPVYEGNTTVKGRTGEGSVTGAYGVLEAQGDTMVLVLRGAQYYPDWNVVFGYVQESNPNYPGMVVETFATVADALFPEVKAAILQAVADSPSAFSKLVVVGHSLGGAVGSLLVDRLTTDGEISALSLMQGSYFFASNPSGNAEFFSVASERNNWRYFSYEIDLFTRLPCIGCAPDQTEGGTAGCPASAGGPFPGGEGERFPAGVPRGMAEIKLKAGGALVPQINNLNIAVVHVCSYSCWSQTAVEKETGVSLTEGGATDFCSLSECMAKNTVAPLAYTGSFFGQLVVSLSFIFPSILGAAKKMGMDTQSLADEVMKFRLGSLLIDKEMNVKISEGKEDPETKESAVAVWLREGSVLSASEKFAKMGTEAVGFKLDTLSSLVSGDVGKIGFRGKDSEEAYEMQKEKGEEYKSGNSSFNEISTMPLNLKLENQQCADGKGSSSGPFSLFSSWKDGTLFGFGGGGLEAPSTKSSGWFGSDGFKVPSLDLKGWNLGGIFGKTDDGGKA
uniref:Fungal lipase-type domain-containing protein n=1 Tax=Chromera velia CCMP2878 TaxID=1169474 RepID=A0A0G4FZ32_9ALVE|mmetsp:Transcript_8410/g.16339  ORF Transcript_8410/g.16339 Transcript_8410/m.16339 type:complete len:715 (+) Transcript_8410:155-2299(+)|eukprot:Cvel_19442.t1-p1 / transcript=Cvel_19442.t1 / gene=Cvel_19442 / organism=Chromera_velia_CCMP2878 / gene_product=hypothetical protein / transcript_product=hypothetical protein / location=Cvel_scaffold1676:26883-30425(+) / protein_length=714 / sequence_SO=supercontig / SO=protein_coding / is_pseudo=false